MLQHCQPFKIPITDGEWRVTNLKITVFEFANPVAILCTWVPFVPQMIPGWHMWCRKCQSIGLDFEAHRELIKIMTRPAIMTKNLAIILSEAHVSDLKGVLVHNFIWICNYMRGTERRRGNLNENGRGTFCRFVKIGYNHTFKHIFLSVCISRTKFLVFRYYLK